MNCMNEGCFGAGNMRRIFIILLIAFVAVGCFFTTEYSGPINAYCDTEEGQAEVLYVLNGTDTGIKEIPISSLIFTSFDMNKEIEWYFTPLEEKVLSTLSLDQKIGQLFIVRPEALSGGSAPAVSMTDPLRKAMGKRMPCGVIMFADNIVDPSQIKAFNEALHFEAYSYSPVPMLIAVDEEGGAVARIANNWNFSVQRFDSMLSIGNTGDTVEAFKAGLAIGTYLKEYGFDLDLAPVADCFTNPDNRVIGDRSFGSDPALVSQMVGECIDGLHSRGIMATIKHYPGHGDTENDTHSGAVVTKRSWDELKARELIPFIDNLSKTDMIMTAHIVSSGVTGDDLPATLSSVMINEKLRGELGYEGVVITDSMEMGAISSEFSQEEAAVRAIEAGCDIILCPGDYNRAYDAVMEAVSSGRLSEERIDESVLRIIRMKLGIGKE